MHSEFWISRFYTSSNLKRDVAPDGCVPKVKFKKDMTKEEQNLLTQQYIAKRKAEDAVREICPMCNRKMPRKIACAKDNSEVA